MNKQTHFFIKKNIPLTLYSRKGCERVDVGYVWEMSWRRGQTATYWPKVLLATIAAPLPHLGWAAQPRVAEDSSPLSEACSHSAAFYLQLRLELNLNWLEMTDWLTTLSVAPGYIIIWYPPAYCGRMHLHWIQPRPRIKVISRYPRPEAPVSSAYLHRCLFWLTALSRVNMLQHWSLGLCMGIHFPHTCS